MKKTNQNFAELGQSTKKNKWIVVAVCIVFVALAFMLRTGPLNPKQEVVSWFISAVAIFFVIAFLVLPAIFRNAGHKTKRKILKLEESANLSSVRVTLEEKLDIPLAEAKKVKPTYDEPHDMRTYFNNRHQQKGVYN